MIEIVLIESYSKASWRAEARFFGTLSTFCSYEHKMLKKPSCRTESVERVPKRPKKPSLRDSWAGPVPRLKSFFGTLLTLSALTGTKSSEGTYKA